MNRIYGFNTIVCNDFVSFNDSTALRICTSVFEAHNLCDTRVVECRKVLSKFRGFVKI